MAEVTRRRRRLGACGALVVAAVVGFTVAVVGLDVGVSGGAPTVVTVDPPAAIAVTSRSPGVSGDGQVVAFVGAVTGGTALFVGTPTAGGAVAIPNPQGVVRVDAPAISGDGCRVVFWGSANASGPSTGPPTTPPSSAPPTPGSVGLYRYDRCATPVAAAQVIPTTVVVTTASSVVAPALSRDGHIVAYAARASAADSWQVATIDLTTSAETPVTSPPAITALTTVDLDSAGATVAFDAGTDPASPATSAVYVGPPTAPVAVAPPAGSTVVGMPSLTADGSTVAFVAGDTAASGLYVKTAATAPTPAPVRVATSDARVAPITAPDITPDGSQLVYALGSAIVAIYATSAGFATASTPPEAISPLGSTNAAPSVSDTGQLVVFAAADAQGLSSVMAAKRVPVLTPVTPTFDLGTVAVGASSPPAAVMFTNASSVAIIADQVAPLAAPFSIINDTCSKTFVAPGGTCTVTVEFSPTDSVTSTATLTVAGQGATASASLTGTGRSLVRSIAITPSTLQFPNTQVGSRGGPVTGTVTNSGELPVEIDGVSIGGSDGGQFVLTGNACAGATLAVDETCTFSVTAIPARAGSMRGTVTVAGMEGESDDATLAVTATSVTTTTTRVTTTTRPTTTTTAPIGRLASSPSTVSFPAGAVGTTTEPIEVTVINNGGSTVSRLKVTIAGGVEFAIVDDTCSGSNLGVGTSCTVSVVATPAASGAATGSLDVLGSKGESTSVALFAAAFAPTLRVNPGVGVARGTTTLVGTGFAPSAVITLQMVAPNGAGTPLPLGSITADPDGAFRVLVTLPQSAGQGGWRIQALDATQASPAQVAILIQPGSVAPGAPGGAPVVGDVPRPPQG